MISPESLLHQPGKLQMPSMPGLDQHQAQPNPFSGIRRAGQAKRAQNFERWQGKSGSQNFGKSDASFEGAKNQNFGGLAGTQSGSMRQNKF